MNRGISRAIKKLADREYRFTATVEGMVLDNGCGGKKVKRVYIIHFPDLPGCVTQAERLCDIPKMVEEVKQVWLATLDDMGKSIPRPTVKFGGLK